MQESGMFLELGIAFAGGFAGALVMHAGLARKVYNLQCDIATLQERLLHEKNSRAALIRHRDQASLEDLKNLSTAVGQAPKVNPLQKFGIRS